MPRARGHRQRILSVTAEPLQRSPAKPVSTRAICDAAGVTAPTLCHHFGDKDGLYDAVATYGSSPPARRTRCGRCPSR